VVVEYENVFQKGLDLREVSTNRVQLTIRGNDLSGSFRDGEWISNWDGLVYVIQNFVSVNELSVGFKVINSWQDTWIKQVFNHKLS
jgi:hypothetical protein